MRNKLDLAELEAIVANSSIGEPEFRFSYITQALDKRIKSNDKIIKKLKLKLKDAE